MYVPTFPIFLPDNPNPDHQVRDLMLFLGPIFFCSLTGFIDRWWHEQIYNHRSWQAEMHKVNVNYIYSVSTTMHSLMQGFGPVFVIEFSSTAVKIFSAISSYCNCEWMTDIWVLTRPCIFVKLKMKSYLHSFHLLLFKFSLKNIYWMPNTC